MRKLSFFLMVSFTAICLHTTRTNAQSYAHQKTPATTTDDGSGATGKGGDGEKTKSAPKTKYVVPDTTSSAIDLTAAVYTALPYLKDDNPAGFTQTYLQATFWRTPRHKTYEIDTDTTGKRDTVFVPQKKTEFTPFKSFFLQGYFSTNVTAANTIDSPVSKPSTGYINRLDLFQHANAMINMYENLFSINVHSSLWETMLFLDVTGGYMRTNVSDSVSKSTSNVDSWLAGANISGSFTCHKNIFNLPISFLVTNKFFWINPITNTYSTNLGPQYANKGDALQSFNGNKNFFTTPHPYYNLDVQVAFTISKQAKTDTSGSSSAASSGSPQNKVFVHLGYVTGINNSSNDYYNSYFQAQIGVSLDIVGTINKYTGTKSGSGSDSGTGTGSSSGGTKPKQ